MALPCDHGVCAPCYSTLAAGEGLPPGVDRAVWAQLPLDIRAPDRRRWTADFEGGRTEESVTL